MRYTDIHHLTISWSTSKGRDTYGYNICRLDSKLKRYKCMGGGYDMIGTVFGDWLADAYQETLRTFVSSQAFLEDCNYGVPGYKRVPGLYGLTVNPDGKVTLDGACGISSMISIAEAIGLEVEREGNKKGHTVGFFVAEPCV